MLNKCGKHIALELVAYTNTWSNQRRKKRQLKRMNDIAAKKFKIESEIDTDNRSSEIVISELEEKSTILTSSSESIVKKDPNGSTETGTFNETNESILLESSQNSTKLKEKLNECDTSIENCYESSEEIETLVQSFVKIFKKEGSVYLESEFITGTGGKESLHQIIQYIKNNWK